MRWMSTTALGISLGFLSAWTDVFAGGLEPAPAWRVLAMALNAGCTWAGLAVLCGWVMRTPGRGAVAGFLGLAVAVAAYYGYGVLFGDRSGVGLGVTGAARVWLFASIVVGPVLGVIGAAIRRPGLPGLLASLVVPAGVVAEMLVLRPLSREEFRVDPALAGTRLMLVALAVAGAVYATRRAVGSRRRPVTSGSSAHAGR